MYADPLREAIGKVKVTRGSSAYSALPLWSVYASLAGFAGSIIFEALYFAGMLSGSHAITLLAISLSLAIIASASGSLLALAHRDVAPRRLSRHWMRLPEPSITTFLVLATVLLGIATNVSYQHDVLGVGATIGTGTSFLYLCMITSICVSGSVSTRTALGFLLALSYGFAVAPHDSSATSIFDLSVHLALLGVTGLVMSLLANSIQRELRIKSNYAQEMSARANLWNEIATKAHQIAEMEDPSSIQMTVVEATIALGYELCAIALLDKENGTFRYTHPSPLVPTELLNKSMPLTGIAYAVLRNRNTEIVDYQSYDQPVPTLQQMGTRTTVGIPMWNNGEIVAVLVAGSLTQRDIIAEELTALELLAAAGSSALEQRSVTASLLSQIAQYSSMIEDAPNPTIVLDENQTIVLSSKRSDLLLGYERRQLVGRKLHEFLKDAEPVYTLLGNTAMDFAPVQFQTAATCSDGSRLAVEVTASRGNSVSDQHLVAVALRDITQQRMLEARLLDLSNFDPLTGLANRAHLTHEIRRAMIRHFRTDVPVALIVFELNRLLNEHDSKTISDQDRVLVSIVRQLEGYVRETDLLARIGDGRFAVLIEDLTEARTLSYAQQLLNVVTNTYYVEGQPIRPEATFGVAFASDGISPEILLERANSALLAGLGSKDSKITFFEHQVRTAAQKRLQLENDIRTALSEQQFHLEYQPIVDMRTKQVHAAEALIRWEHPERGRIAPDEFIHVAEETGMIVPIGTWVMRQAAMQLAIWQNNKVVDRDFSMHLNVSRVQLNSDQIVDDIALAVDDFNLDPKMLSVEITETAFLHNASPALDVIFKLSDLGVRLAIDDFGTGYSSLSMLTTIPVDILKMDKSFVDQLGKKADLTVEAIVNIANRLNLILVAEGIETEQQSRRLISMSCNYGQGYLFSRAVPAVDFQKLAVGSLARLP